MLGQSDRAGRFRRGDIRLQGCAGAAVAWDLSRCQMDDRVALTEDGLEIRHPAAIGDLEPKPWMIEAGAEIRERTERQVVGSRDEHAVIEKPPREVRSDEPRSAGYPDMAEF